MLFTTRRHINAQLFGCKLKEKDFGLPFLFTSVTPIGILVGSGLNTPFTQELPLGTDLVRLATLPVKASSISGYDNALYSALKNDIKKRGILIPLVFDAKSGECVDGLVRLQIAREIGLKTIPRVFGHFSPGETVNVRLVLNGLRRHLTRDQVSSLISWTLKKNPKTSDREVGRLTGADHKTVGASRRRLESTGEIPQLKERQGKDGRSRAVSLAFTSSTSQANEARRALSSLGDKAPAGFSAIRKLRRLAKQESRETELKRSGRSLPKHFDLRCCDFRDLDCPDGVADLMVLDPPWHESKELRQPFSETVFRLLKPGGFALIYTGHAGVLDFGDALRSAGLTYRWLISCINASNAGSVRNSGSVFALSRVVSVYQKGGVFKTPSLFKDVIITEDHKDKTWHKWQQSVEESVSFVQAFTKPGDLVMDLTSGTFTVAVATALVGGGRRFLGCEVRPELVDLGKRRVDEVLNA